MNQTGRKELRERSAAYLNALSKDALFKRFAITRIGDVTGLDVLGIPVMTACRPAARIVSVNAGKSLHKPMARAGAIAEAIEFSVFENPGPHAIGTTPDLGFPLAADSTWTPKTKVALEDITHLASGKQVAFPSSLIWLTRPEEEPAYFQKSSNGQALGASPVDALVQAIYECVERDQYVLWRCSLSNLGFWPPRASFTHPAIDAIVQAGLELFLFYCTVDLGIPVYWAILLDPSWRHCGGWGAHLDPKIAAERAVLEAIQSRGVVIAGARDDLERRDPDWTQSVAAIRELASLPLTHEVPDYRLDWSAEAECELVLKRLGSYWQDRIYVKHVDLAPLHLVKVQILGLEQPVMRHWKEIRWSKLKQQYAMPLAF